MVFRTQDSLNLELIWTEPKVSSLENYLHTRCLSDFGLLLTEYHRLSDLYNNRNLFLTVLGCLRYKIRVPAWSGMTEIESILWGLFYRALTTFMKILLS